jgi:hypothetical protein
VVERIEPTLASQCLLALARKPVAGAQPPPQTS